MMVVRRRWRDQESIKHVETVILAAPLTTPLTLLLCEIIVHDLLVSFAHDADTASVHLYMAGQKCLMCERKHTYFE